VIYETLLKLKRSNKPFGIQKAINIMHYDPNRVLLSINSVDYVVIDGYKFRATDQIDSLQRVEGNSWFDGVRSTDFVLDIGANIGAITIPLASKAGYVVAIEPLFSDYLKDNVRLNNLDNVHIMEYAISNQKTMDVIFSSRRKKVACLPFKLLIDELPQIDFLKVDCEGGEWDILPSDLVGIRELRLEFHIRRDHFKDDIYCLFTEWYEWLKDNNYQFEITEGDTPPPFHTIKECYLLNARRNENK
jgi:FkbM family methyltransferase